MSKTILLVPAVNGGRFARFLTVLRRLVREEGRVSLEPRDVEVRPDEAAREYINIASTLVEQAKLRIVKRDLRGAAKRLWGAAILAIEAHSSFVDGKWLSTQKDLWKYKSKLAKRLGEWIHDAWNAAVAMYVSFYEGCADTVSARAAVDRIAKLVKEVEREIQGR